MATREPGSQKTAADLQLWLDRAGQLVEIETELIAHGGTSLSLHGIKESTKDVDFGVRREDDFRRFGDMLRTAGYELRRDFRPRATEVYQRWRNPAEVVDVVDLRHPTWNAWHMTERILRGARILPSGRIRLVLPELETVFLFKTYPLRDTDLDDLQRTLLRTSLNEARLIECYDEQDRLYRQQFLSDEVEYEPVLNVVELRSRVAASLELLGTDHSQRIPEFHAHVRRKFRELRLDLTLVDLAALIRETETAVDWDRVLGKELEAIRKRLAA